MHKTDKIGRFNKDYYGGMLMALTGAVTVFKGRDYQMGTLASMGAGYFPVAVGTVLAATGILLMLGAFRRKADDGGKPAHPPEWRGWSAIVLANLAFIVFGHYGGLVPATFAIVFISALGDRQNTIKGAFLLSLAMVAVCVVVFHWGLALQFPLFRWG